MCIDSQGENSIHPLLPIADFHLECCILMQITKNKTSVFALKHVR